MIGVTAVECFRNPEVRDPIPARRLSLPLSDEQMGRILGLQWPKGYQTRIDGFQMFAAGIQPGVPPNLLLIKSDRKE